MINQELANKINSLLDKGVTFGLSKDPKPGKMCVEQAVCYALGEEITDKPSCVDEEVRGFVTRLNDFDWSSPSARAEGMRDLAIAQLGSNSLDQDEFREKLSYAVLTNLLPAMFKDMGKERWKKEINSLEEVKSLEEARKVATDAASSSASPSAASASNSAVYAAPYACTVTAAYNSTAYAAYYAADLTKTGDKYLKMISHLAVEVLKGMKSPGCQFL